MKFFDDESGTSALEFAMIAPLFLLLLIGIMAYGLYFGATHSVQELASDAARAAVAGKNDDERINLATEAVAQNTERYPLLDPQSVGMSAVVVPLDGTSRQVVVSVQYDSANLPIWDLTPFLPLPSQIIERSAVVTLGRF